jgi:hypothetical protein
MIRLIVSAAGLSFALVSAAWALPAAPKSELPTLNQSDIIQVGERDRRHDGRKHYRRHDDYRDRRRHGYRDRHYRGRYYHGGRYWGRRYYYRPYNWEALGCIVVGPVWYCP